MDWLLLIVVPIVAVAIVLLFGFTGCAGLLGLDDVKYNAPPPPAPPNPAATAPTDLVATVLGTNLIRLEWKHKDPGNVSFEITRSGGVSGPQTNQVGKGVATNFQDSTFVPADEGQTFAYTVKAFDGATSSDPSNRVSPTLWKRETLFSQTLTQVDNPLQFNTLVQIIGPSAYRQFTGNVERMKLFLKGVSGQPILRFTQVSLSHAAPPNPASPPQRWDSDPNMVRFNAQQLAATLEIPQTDFVEFKLDRARELLVAFDIISGNTAQLQGLQGVGGCAAFARPNTAEAGTADRSGGYLERFAATGGGAVYFVERIEVIVSFGP